MSVKAPLTKDQLNQLLLTHVPGAVQEVFQTMAYTEIMPIEGSNDKADLELTGDISAIMTISNLTTDGVLSISFPLDLAKEMVARLIGFSPDELEKQDYCDGVGEVLNMVAGRVKMVLSHEEAEPYRLSLPSIVFGQEHTVGRRSDTQARAYFLFEIEGQQFSVQCCFNRSDS